MMYNFELLHGEEIIKIIDDVLIYSNNSVYTFIITNQRLLILAYPSGYHNSMEDLRISGKASYVRMKEIVLEKSISDIETVLKETDKYVIRFKDDSFIKIDNSDVYKVIKEVNYENKWNFYKW